MMKLMQFALIAVLAVGAVAWADHDVDVPYYAPEGTATIDADLSDWAGATWIPLDETYTGDVSDASAAAYALRWSSATNLLYVAVTITDTDHRLEDAYVAWNGQDDCEFYVDAGNNDVDYTSLNDWAQHFFIGAGVTPGVTWGNVTEVDIVPEFAADVNGDVITYEASVIPYSYYTGLGGTAGPQVEVDLADGTTIGFDVVAGTLNSVGFGMLSNNLIPSKFRVGAAIQTWILEGGGTLQADFDGDGDVDLDDFVILKTNFGLTPPADGDADGDGDVDLDDFVILKNEFGS